MEKPKGKRDRSFPALCRSQLFSVDRWARDAWIPSTGPGAIFVRPLCVPWVRAGPIGAVPALTPGLRSFHLRGPRVTPVGRGEFPGEAVLRGRCDPSDFYGGRRGGRRSFSWALGIHSARGLAVISYETLPPADSSPHRLESSGGGRSARQGLSPHIHCPSQAGTRKILDSDPSWKRRFGLRKGFRDIMNV